MRRLSQPRSSRAHAHLLLLLLAGLACTGQPRALLVVDVSAETTLPLSRLRVTAAGVRLEEPGGAPQSLGVYLKVQRGPVTAVAEGLDDDGRPVARGATTPVSLAPGQVVRVSAILTPIGESAGDDASAPLARDAASEIDETPPPDPDAAAFPIRDASVVMSRDSASPLPRDSAPPRDVAAPPDTAPDAVVIEPGPARLSLSPSSHDFGWEMEGGSSADFPFVLTNIGGATSGTPVIKLGKDTVPFSFRAGTPACTGPLASGKSCTILVRYNPLSASNQGFRETETLQVTGSPGGAASANVTGLSLLADGLRLTPFHHDFGAPTVATAFVFTLTNTMTVPNGPLHFLVTGDPYSPDADPFVFDASDCLVRTGGTLAVGGSCTISVRFEPGRAGGGFVERFFQIAKMTGESAAGHVQANAP